MAGAIVVAKSLARRRLWPSQAESKTAAGQRSLDDPAARVDDEAGLVGDPADDLDIDAGGVGDAVGVVAAIGEGPGDERVARARCLRQRHGSTVAILHVGGMHEQPERAAIGVDHGVALAAEDLGGIIAARAAAFRGFHRLAVAHRSRRA